MDEFSFSGTGLRRLAFDLDAAASRLNVTVAQALTEIGSKVEERAKKNALSYVSSGGTTVAGRQVSGKAATAYGGNTKEDVANSIKGHLENPVVYRLRYGEGVPIAVLWELGNRGAPESATEFRHPLFGNKKVWKPQKKHPFLRPALEESSAAIGMIMNSVWDRTLTPVGLRPETTSILGAPAFPGAPVGRVPAGTFGGSGGQFATFSP